MKLEELKDQLDRIEKHLIFEAEIKSYGHRLIYDKKTGISQVGSMIEDLSKLDENGYQVML